jgi:hypothetical protein
MAIPKWYVTMPQTLSALLSASRASWEEGDKLDPACPNVVDHGDEYHEIDGEQFMDCLEAQLTLQSPQFELQPLHITSNGN